MANTTRFDDYQLAVLIREPNVLAQLLSALEAAGYREKNLGLLSHPSPVFSGTSRSEHPPWLQDATCQAIHMPIPHPGMAYPPIAPLLNLSLAPIERAPCVEAGPLTPEDLIAHYPLRARDPEGLLKGSAIGAVAGLFLGTMVMGILIPPPLYTAYFLGSVWVCLALGMLLGAWWGYRHDRMLPQELKQKYRFYLQQGMHILLISRREQPDLPDRETLVTLLQSHEIETIHYLENYGRLKA